MISSTKRRRGLDAGASTRSSSAYPVITVSTLLKSPATPRASRPTASIFSAWVACSSNCRRLPISRKTRIAPRTPADSSRTGEALSSMGLSTPLRDTSTVCSNRDTVARSRNARASGFSIGSCVASCTSLRISDAGLPRASFRGHPVSVSATGFRNVTMPSLSVASTASPMLESVASKRRRLSRQAEVIQVINTAIATNAAICATVLHPRTGVPESARGRSKRWRLPTRPSRRYRPPGRNTTR